MTTVSQQREPWGGRGQGRDALPWEKGKKNPRLPQGPGLWGAQAPEGGRGRVRDNPLLHHRQQTHLHLAAATPVFQNSFLP